MTVLGKRALNSAVAIAALAACATCAMAARAHSDAQGWNGSGWYISSSTAPEPVPPATPAYILFEGPYELRSGCIAVYDLLYSPIGICRLLSVKPGGRAGSGAPLADAVPMAGTLSPQ